MGAALVILIIVSILGSGMALFTLWNPVYELSFTQRFWNQTEIPIDADVQITRDALYSAMFVIPFFIVGTLTLWAVLATNRRDDI